MTKPARGFQVWLIAILKGGARKTTTAMFTAFALAAKGHEVLVIDADTGTQGVTDWVTRMFTNDPDVDLPFHVHQWSHGLGLLVPFVQQKQRETGASIVIIDVGGEAPEVLKQAALLADLVVSPVGAEQGEIGRLDPTKAILGPAATRQLLLLTRVPQKGVGAARAARDSFMADGYQVLRAEIPQNRDRYAHVWGSVPDDLGDYDSLADELLKAS